MKRVFRSTFDPLPRSLSTPGLVSLVLVVVLGTAVTVHRYMESSGHPRGEVYGQGANTTLGGRLEVRPSSTGPRASSLGSGRFTGGTCESSTSASGASGCSSTSAPATAAQPTTPSAFEPQ